MNPESGAGRYRLGLVLLFLGGLGLRLYSLDRSSLWFDEVASLEVAQRGPGFFFTDRFGWMLVQTPLHYLLAWLTLQFADPTVSAFWVRLPSALEGSLTVLAAYALGRELFGRAQGFAAASFVALAPVALNYSQDVRPYSMLTLLSVLAAYSLVRATRTGKPLWWAGFAVLTILDMLNAYVALTVFLPALAPSIVIGLWTAWDGRRRNAPKSFYAAVIAVVAVGVTTLLVLLDMKQVPRAAPDLGRFSTATLAGAPIELVTWFTQFGLAGLEKYVELFLMLLAAGGILMGIVRRQWVALVLCASMIWIPSLVLAALGTTNVVYQRYSLFSMAFYFLLIANGAAAGLQAAPHLRGRRALPRFAAAALTGLSIAFFVGGAIVYTDASLQDRLVVRPDFKSVTAYLSRTSRPNDTLVFAGWDPTVARFYWKGHEPAAVYSVLDPRLFNRKLAGDLYWLISYDFDLPQQAIDNPTWTPVYKADRVTVFRENQVQSTVAPGMDRLLGALESIAPRSRPVEQVTETIRGTILQGRGQVSQAAQAYKRAGTYFPIGAEYLRTSRAFFQHGELVMAWREALVAKTMEPQRPDLHEWMGEFLRGQGMVDEATVESNIAGRLKSVANAAGP